MNRIRALQRFNPVVKTITIESYIYWLRHGALFFDGDYQREYVWKEKEQQAFLRTAVSGFPLGHVALAKRPDWGTVDGPYIEVVDGKQRLTTIWLFITDQIPLILPEGPVLWSQLSREEQLAFCSASLPAVELNNASRAQLLEFFYTTNFSGIAQSEEHKARILQLQADIQP